MRTRTSPRNQERLFRELFQPPSIQPLPPSIRCWDCVSYPAGGRARGECILAGVIVCGITAGRECFRPRRKL